MDGPLSAAVDSGFSLTFENRGQTSPPVTFSGGGTVRLGTLPD